MGKLLVGMACAILVASPAMAQGTKTAKGAVTAVAADSITVNVNGTEMKFAVDSKTDTIARGGSTKTREAQAAGKAGVALTEVVKAGDGVEVRYHEAGMHAATIRVLAAVPKAETPGAPAAPKSQTATGTVSAVAADSLTVKGDAGEWTFAIDKNTTVIGTGVGTAGRKMTNMGEKTTLTDFVAEGDTVRVTFHEMDGTKHAASVRITAKKK